MLEKIEAFLKDLLSSLQAAKFYAFQHPAFYKSVNKCYISLKDILAEREQLVIGIIGDELAFEKEILFDLSKAVSLAITYLKEKGIEKISFYRGAQEEELSKFIKFLATPKGETGAPQEYFRHIGIKNIIVDKIKAPLAGSADNLKEPKAYSAIFEDTLDKLSKSLTKLLDRGAVDSLVLRLVVNNLMEELGSHYPQLLQLATLKRYDLGTSAHLINVSILAMYLASKIGFSKDEVLDIGIAAVFHDIGKLYISRKILTKAESLKSEEFKQIQGHTILGAEFLLKEVDTLGILPVVVCFEHHLKYNLTGYPRLFFLKKPHIASSLVSICDVYDALSQRRGYKMDYSPDVIYNIMNKEKGKAFEPELLDKFFKIMGVWPLGSIVALSDGRIATVIDENEDDIFSPKVEVIQPEDKRGMLDLKEKKTEVIIARFLNPWKEGKEFFSKIKL